MTSFGEPRAYWSVRAGSGQFPATASSVLSGPRLAEFAARPRTMSHNVLARPSATEPARLTASPVGIDVPWEFTQSETRN